MASYLTRMDDVISPNSHYESQTSSYHPIPSHFYGQVLTLQKHQTPSAGVIFVLTGYRFFPTTIWLMDRSLASKVQGLWPLSPPSTMSLIICTVLLYYISPHHSSSYFQNFLHQLFLPNHTNLPVSTMPWNLSHTHTLAYSSHHHSPLSSSHQQHFQMHIITANPYLVYQ